MRKRLIILFLNIVMLLFIITIMLSFPIWVFVWVVSGFDTMDYISWKFYHLEEKIKNAH